MNIGEECNKTVDKRYRLYISERHIMVFFQMEPNLLQGKDINIGCFLYHTQLIYLSEQATNIKVKFFKSFCFFPTDKIFGMSYSRCMGMVGLGYPDECFD